MDFNHPINAQRRHRRRKFSWRKFFIGFGLVCLGIICLIGCLPALLSTSAMREHVLASINDRIAPATLTIESWSFAWFQTQSLSGITYTNPTYESSAAIQTVSFSSLWKLLPIRKVIADLHIENPEIALPSIIPAPISTEPSPPTDTPSQSPTPKEKPSLLLPMWDIAINTKVTNLRVTSPQLPTPILHEGNLTFSLPAIDQSIQVTLIAKVLDADLNAEVTLCTAEQILANGLSAKCLTHATASLQAPWVNCQATARGTTHPRFPEATFSLSLNTGKAFSFIRPLNLLPPALSSISGQLAIAAQVHPVNATQIQTSCTVTSRDLSCAYDGKTLLCNPKVAADVLWTPNHLSATELRKMEVDLPGISIHGAGTVTNGNLSATVNSMPFWESFAPFIGEYPLRQPVSIALTAKALNQTLTVETQLTSNKAPLGDATLKVDALDPVAQSFKNLKLSSHWSIANLLAATTQLPKGISAAGDAYLNLGATGSLANLRANAAFAFRNIALQATSWQIQEPTLLEGKASVAITDQQNLTVSALNLTGPLLQLEGDLTAILAPQGPLSGKLVGKLTPEPLLNKWRVWGKDEHPLHLAGEIATTLSIQKTDTPLVCAAQLAAEKFTITPAQSTPISLPFDLNLALAHTATATKLNQFALNSPCLTVESTGDFDAKAKRLKLMGKLTPDFTQLFSVIPSLAANRNSFAVTGRHTRDFTFDAPIGQGLPGILNYGSATAEIAFDQVLVPGLDIPEGVATLQLREGVAAIDSTVTVNEGQVILQPRLNLSGTTPILSWEPHGKVLDHVRLTPKLFDAALGAVNPMLTGSANPDGYISVTCQSLHLPLTENLLAGLSTEMQIQAEACRLQPNGPVKKVIATITGKEHPIQLDDAAFSVTVVDGLLTTAPISLRIEDLKLSCQGSTNLATQAINYTVTIPLNAKLLGRSLASSIKPGETITLPIRGTVKEPLIDTSPLLRLFTETAVEKAKDKLTNKLEKVLKKRAEKRQRKKVSEKTEPEDALEEALRGLFGN